MSLLSNIFGSKPAAPAVTPGTNPASGPNSAANNPTAPTGDQSNPAADATKSPLSKYEDLWKTDPNAPKAPDGSLIPAFNIDPQKLMADAKNLNFVSHIDPELFKKAAAGDVESLMSVVNQAGQLGFAQAATASAEITKQSFAGAQDTLKSTVLPAAIRNDSVSQALAENPVFQNPAIAPMLDSVKTALLTKYPTATPQEIAGMAKEYVNEFAMQVAKGNGQMIVDPTKQRGEAIRRTDTDWENYFDIPANQRVDAKR